MSDLFHEEVSADFIKKVFEIIKKCDQHIFQVLTKRSSRLLDLSEKLDLPSNAWIGVSVENSDALFRIDDLINCPAKIKFVSFEPLIGPIADFIKEGLDWVIVGGESGPNARPMKRSWVTEIRDQCVNADIPFFFKQWGGTRRTDNGRELDGRIWNEIPAIPNQIQNEYIKQINLQI